MKLLMTTTLLLFFSIGLITCQNIPAKPSEELIAAFENDSTLLLDVRTVQEYNEGHIDGSLNIPVNHLEFKLDSLKKYPHIIVFCRSGKRAANAKRILNEAGIENVVNAGGWASLQNVIDELKVKKCEENKNINEDLP